MKIVIAILLMLSMSACSMLPQNETNDFRGQVGQAYTLASVLSARVGVAQEQGYIDVEQEDKLLDSLETSVNSLDALSAVGSETETERQQLQAIRDVLQTIQLQLQLREEK